MTLRLPALSDLTTQSRGFEARLRRLLSVLIWLVLLSLGAGALFDLWSWNVAAFLASSSALLWRFADERLSRPRRQTSP